MRFCRAGVFVLLAALAGTPGAQAFDLDEVAKRGTLRVVVWTENLPELFAVKPGTTSTGLEQELLQGFAALHKLKVEVVPVTTLEILRRERPGNPEKVAMNAFPTAPRSRTIPRL